MAVYNNRNNGQIRQINIKKSNSFLKRIWYPKVLIYEGNKNIFVLKFQKCLPNQAFWLFIHFVNISETFCNIP